MMKMYVSMKLSLSKYWK